MSWCFSSTLEDWYHHCKCVASSNTLSSLTLPHSPLTLFPLLPFLFLLLFSPSLQHLLQALCPCGVLPLPPLPAAAPLQGDLPLPALPPGSWHGRWWQLLPRLSILLLAVHTAWSMECAGMASSAPSPTLLCLLLLPNEASSSSFLPSPTGCVVLWIRHCNVLHSPLHPALQAAS